MMALTITIKQFCNLTGLGRTKAFELIKQKRLAAVKVDGRTLLTMDSVAALIENSLVREV